MGLTLLIKLARTPLFNDLQWPYTIPMTNVKSTEYQPILDQLIDHGANINAQDHKGYTMLHWAINNEILMRHLLDHGYQY